MSIILKSKTYVGIFNNVNILLHNYAFSNEYSFVAIAEICSKFDMKTPKFLSKTEERLVVSSG